MCGLVGVAGNLYKTHTDAFTDLLYCDTLRGTDSTGVVSSDANGDIYYLKRLGPAGDLIDARGYDSVTSINRRVIMGHNRSATVGAKSKYNAHPFFFDRIVGAHNGTLTTAGRNRLIDNIKFSTDSEALFNNIEQEGIEKTIAKLEGAWALTILDRDAMTLHFIRNDQRPLHYAFNKERTVIFWSSEVGLLMWIMARRGIEAEKFYQLPTDMLYTFKIPKGGEKWGEPETKEMKGHVPENFQYGGPYAGGLFQNRVPHNKRPEPSISPADNSANSGSANAKPGGSQPDGTEETRSPADILKAIELHAGPDCRGEWWEAGIPCDIGDDNEWQWHMNESSQDWLKRVRTMLQMGWEWGEEGASSAVTAPKERASTTTTTTKSSANTTKRGSNIGKPILNRENDKVWNEHHRKWQPLPFRGAEAFWSDKNKLWVFNPQFVRGEVPNKDKYWNLSGKGIDWVSILAEEESKKKGKRVADDDSARREWEQAVEDHDYFLALKEKKDKGLEFTQQEFDFWLSYTEGDDDGPPPFDVEKKKEESNVILLRPYIHPNTRAELSKLEFEEIIQNGCDWCTKSVQWGDKVRFHCCGPDVEVFCEECSENNPDVKHYLRIM